MTKSWPNPFHIFQWGSCQTVDILSSKTFWNSAISSFSKKWLFSNKKYFHISQTCKNDSAPPSLHLKIGPNFKARGGVRGHFGMFCLYESTFYCWTAAFYGMKISCRVKKLLKFEGRPSHVFSIQIYRGNLAKIWCFLSIFFYFLTFHVVKHF